MAAQVAAAQGVDAKASTINTIIMSVEPPAAEEMIEGKRRGAVPLTEGIESQKMWGDKLMYDGMFVL